MTTQLFDCDVCDGPVVMRTGSGRTREYRKGIKLPVPDGFSIATCEGCGAEDRASHPVPDEDRDVGYSGEIWLCQGCDPEVI